MQRHDGKRSIPLRLYGHRGASALMPENTLPAFERALADGANALELDVHLTSDGQVVVAHDAIASRTTGMRVPFTEAGLDEVRRWDAGWGFVDRQGNRPFANKGLRIPTLAEVLQAFPGTVLNVDLKPPDRRIVPAAMELVARHGAEERVTLTSFHDANLDELRRLGYRGAIGLGPREVRWIALAPHRLSRWRGCRGNALQIPRRAGPLRLDTPELIAHAHALGLRVDYWVIDEPEVARTLLERGADGLVTNDPARVRAVFEAFLNA